MTNVNFESVGIPDVGFSLTKVGDQLFFPCGPVFEFVGFSTNSTVVKQGYSCLKKSFAGVSISEPFCKMSRSGKTFLTAEAFLSLVFGGASSFTRSQTFDVDRLLSLREFFTARIFEGRPRCSHAFGALLGATKYNKGNGQWHDFKHKWGSKTEFVVYSQTSLFRSSTRHEKSSK